MNDSLGDRMKRYELSSPTVRLLPGIPVMARMDGRAFHTFTKGLERPYDIRLSNLMVDVTKYLVGATNATCGYTQSDEITLSWYEHFPKGEQLFGGKVQKLVSVLASMTSVKFVQGLQSALPEKATASPVFDCRVWQLPVNEVANNFIWREMDATRNSVQMAARSVFSDRDCFKKSTSQLQEMLFSVGINWNEYPAFFKRVRTREVDRQFTQEELDSLPEKHQARTNPSLCVRRRVVMVEDFEPLTKYFNRTDMVLKGDDPITWQSND